MGRLRKKEGDLSKEYLNTLNAIGRIFSQIRRDKDLTQGGFGKLAGKPQSTVAKIEKGASADIALRVIYELAAGAGIKLSELFQAVENDVSGHIIGKIQTQSEVKNNRWAVVIQELERIPSRSKESVAHLMELLIEILEKSDRRRAGGR